MNVDIDKLSQQLLEAAKGGHLATCACMGITLASAIQAIITRPPVSETDAITAARAAGHREGYDLGYDAGYCDGRADLELELSAIDDDSETVYSLTAAGRAALGQAQASGGAA